MCFHCNKVQQIDLSLWSSLIAIHLMDAKQKSLNLETWVSVLKMLNLAHIKSKTCCKFDVFSSYLNWVEKEWWAPGCNELLNGVNWKSCQCLWRNQFSILYYEYIWLYTFSNFPAGEKRVKRFNAHFGCTFKNRNLHFLN